MEGGAVCYVAENFLPLPHTICKTLGRSVRCGAMASAAIRNFYLNQVLQLKYIVSRNY